jgi:hypothetical protein
MQDPTPARVDLFVTLPTASHRQRSVHVDVVTGEVETDQALEDDAPPRKRRREENEQARCRTSIGDHVKDCAERR